MHPDDTPEPAAGAPHPAATPVELPADLNAALHADELDVYTPEDRGDAAEPAPRPATDTAAPPGASRRLRPAVVLGALAALILLALVTYFLSATA